MQGKQAKIVKVDLLAESKKLKASGALSSSRKSGAQNQKQFSFSQQNTQTSPYNSNSSPSRKNVSRNLFQTSSRSPQRRQIKNNKKSSPMKNEKWSKTKQKPKLYNQNYQKINQYDRFFKKPISQIKGALFHDNKNSKDQVKKTLRQIGKYAEHKSKEKYNKSQKKQSKSPIKNIPVQIYVSESNRNKAVRQQLASLSMGTYSAFENKYTQVLKQNDDQYDKISIKFYKPGQVNSLVQERQPSLNSECQEDRFNRYHEQRQQSIQQNQIDAVCQIFQLCQKYQEGDRIVSDDFYRLLEELERLYFIKIIQENQFFNQDSEPLPRQNQYYKLLKDFQDTFRIIFYRKQANNIYDTLFYLKQANRLERTLIIFSELKHILSLRS